MPRSPEEPGSMASMSGGLVTTRELQTPSLVTLRQGHVLCLLLVNS